MKAPDQPLDQWRTAILVDEVLLHAQAALGAFARMRALLIDEATRERRDVWVELQGFLTHAALVSKFLHPASTDGVALWRASQLRKTLGYDEPSPFSDRNARNFLDHIDERLDLWAAPKEFRGLLEIVFENQEDAEYLDPDRWFWRRALIIDPPIFCYDDKDGKRRMELMPLIKALQELRARASVYVGRVFAPVGDQDGDEDPPFK